VLEQAQLRAVSGRDGEQEIEVAVAVLLLVRRIGRLVRAMVHAIERQDRLHRKIQERLQRSAVEALQVDALARADEAPAALPGVELLADLRGGRGLPVELHAADRVYLAPSREGRPLEIRHHGP